METPGGTRGAPKSQVAPSEAQVGDGQQQSNQRETALNRSLLASVGPINKKENQTQHDQDRKDELKQSDLLDGHLYGPFGPFRCPSFTHVQLDDLGGVA